MVISGRSAKASLAATAGFVALCGCVAPASAGPIEDQIIRNVIQNILQNVRDQIQSRKVLPAPGMLRFSAEESEFDNRNPFAAQGSDNPFAALAYAKSPVLKAPPMAVAPAPLWIYGVNAVGSEDLSRSFGTVSSTSTGTGAFDVTKIGIFTASDALTFVATGSDSWSHTSGFTFSDSNTPSGSGTLAYTNGGFSTDFTVTASWTRTTLIGLGIVGTVPDTSSLSYTDNVQYKYDLPYSVFIEPTVGVTYTELYTANFGMKTGDSTEVHGGARIGTQMKWMGFVVEPQISGAVFKVVDQSGIVAAPGLPPGFGGVPVAVAGVTETGLGGRGSAKVNVIWTDHFSSYFEGHGSGVAGTKTQGFVATQTIGGSVGLRYTW
ncbi:hypothetical protein SAMN05444159_4956 [Bradyrhizobium lablabi]|uniref:Uncharacterized protein n=1 Tax=Bradyrhizobium lablabi TaxID=722472 RepID=A0A1M6XRP7_9BRAD|nr:autotransporter domain-containing protein [Bradyrhizobium lablabi]SHL08662.1 hypothetical protein SAMN05444159_4956 [Bradyrhizobium lablabi]